MVFGASDAVHGFELWVTDGSEAGTRLVKDIRPGPDSSLVWIGDPGFMPVGDSFVFVANDGVHGYELWCSDGTDAGTFILRDVMPGPEHGVVQTLLALGGRVYFDALDSEHGRELWATDGTAAGTVLVADISPGAESSKVRDPTPFGDGLAFVAEHEATGAELWTSDGTASGTRLVKDIFPGPDGSLPSGLRAIAGTLYFVARDGIHGWELWRSDGTEVGTTLGRDINPGAANAFALDLHPHTYKHAIFERPLVDLYDVFGTVLFVADDGQHGREWWRSDGTAAGTTLVEDINPGSPWSGPGAPVANGSRLFFAAQQEATGTELWSIPLAEVAAPCVGDCDASWQVDVSELLRGVNVALGTAPLAGCPPFDAQGDGQVSIDDLTTAIGNALAGCQSTVKR